MNNQVVSIVVFFGLPYGILKRNLVKARKGTTKARSWGVGQQDFRIKGREFSDSGLSLEGR